MPKTMIECLTVRALVQVRDLGGRRTATVSGTATINGLRTTYCIDVEDKGEPGMARDIFMIQTTSGYTAGGLLARGNLQVHH